MDCPDDGLKYLFHKNNVKIVCFFLRCCFPLNDLFYEKMLKNSSSLNLEHSVRLCAFDSIPKSVCLSRKLLTVCFIAGKE